MFKTKKEKEAFRVGVIAGSRKKRSRRKVKRTVKTKRARVYHRTR